MEKNETIATITPEELKAKLGSASNVLLVDVRSPAEFQELHVEGARNLPLEWVSKQAVSNLMPGGGVGPVYLICRGGSRGRMACERLAKEGGLVVLNVEGGTLACEKSGLPVIRGKKRVSIERQVRMAAGSLILLGVVLGVTVHLGFLGLSAFVGAGLVFAGVTDTAAWV